MTGNLRDVAPHRDRSARDPEGKRALFSASAEPPDPTERGAGATATTGAESRAAAPSTPSTPTGATASADSTGATGGSRSGTVVVECASCGERTRLDYFDFALLNLPISFFLPIPGRRFKHRMTCPACSRWTWLEARWHE